MGNNLSLPTPRQIKVLRAVRARELSTGSPTLEELASDLNCSLSAVYKVLTKLISLELLTKTSAHRSLATTRRGKLLAASQPPKPEQEQAA